MYMCERNLNNNKYQIGWGAAAWVQDGGRFVFLFQDRIVTQWSQTGHLKAQSLTVESVGQQHWHNRKKTQLILFLPTFCESFCFVQIFSTCVRILVTELLFTEMIHLPDRCDVSRCWWSSMMSQQVCFVQSGWKVTPCVVWLNISEWPFIVTVQSR